MSLLSFQSLRLFRGLLLCPRRSSSSRFLFHVATDKTTEERWFLVDFEVDIGAFGWKEITGGRREKWWLLTWENVLGTGRISNKCHWTVSMETTKGFLLTRESNSILLKIIDQKKKKNQPPHESQRVRVGTDPELSINLFFYLQEGSQINLLIQTGFSLSNFPDESIQQPEQDFGPLTSWLHPKDLNTCSFHCGRDC